MPEIVNRQKSMKLSAAMTAMLEICLIVSVILSAVDTAEDEGAGYAFCRFIVDGKAPAAAGLDEDAAQVAWCIGAALTVVEPDGGTGRIG